MQRTGVFLILRYTKDSRVSTVAMKNCGGFSCAGEENVWRDQPLYPQSRTRCARSEAESLHNSCHSDRMMSSLYVVHKGTHQAGWSSYMAMGELLH